MPGRGRGRKRKASAGVKQAVRALLQELSSEDELMPLDESPLCQRSSAEDGQEQQNDPPLASQGSNRQRNIINDNVKGNNLRF